MWVIAGLGNHPRKYSGTRHNIGFMVVEELASRHGLTFRDKENYSAAKGSIEDTEVLLMEPLTYMNRSGIAIYPVLARTGTLPEELIVVHDDIDMPPGRLKIKLGGSSGGHRGIDSIIEHLGTMDFIHVKIGVGRDPDMPSEVYVLKKFKKEERPVIKEAIMRAADAVEAILKSGLGEAMNAFNVKA